MQTSPSKVYNMNLVSKEVELPGAFILGAGAVSSKTVGINGEVCIAALKPIFHIRISRPKKMNGPFSTDDF